MSGLAKWVVFWAGQNRNPYHKPGRATLMDLEFFASVIIADLNVWRGYDND